MTLKVVGCEDYVQENMLPLWGLEVKHPAAGPSCKLFGKNSHFNDILRVFRLITKQLNYYDLEEFEKIYFVQLIQASQFVHLLIKSKICVNAKRLHIWFKSFQ